MYLPRKIKKNTRKSGKKTRTKTRTASERIINPEASQKKHGPRITGSAATFPSLETACSAVTPGRWMAILQLATISLVKFGGHAEALRSCSPHRQRPFTRCVPGGLTLGMYSPNWHAKDSTSWHCSPSGNYGLSMVPRAPLGRSTPSSQWRATYGRRQHRCWVASYLETVECV